MLKRDRMLSVLYEAPMTSEDLADWTDSTHNQMKALIGQYRHLFRIVKYKRPEQGRAIAVWGVADGKPDATKPKALTPTQRWRKNAPRYAALKKAKARKTAATPWSGLR